MKFMFQTTNQLWNPPNPSARGTTSSFFASDGSFFGRNFSTTGSSCGKRSQYGASRAPCGPAETKKRVRFGKKNMDWMVVDLPL